MSRIVRRVHQAGVYFVTTHTWQRRELFRREAVANIVIQQLVDCRDRGFCKLHEFVLMPDHLHVLLTPGETTSLEKAVQMIKGGSSRRIGQELHFQWPVWQPGFHDRWIRDSREYFGCRDYIWANPVKARLVEKPAVFQWSSANGTFRLDPTKFEELQGLKPLTPASVNIAVETATHKPSPATPLGKN
ncbi:MAG: transposase [Acidobacteria bacterium]|nr:transposase [Acidobacteriota bacterium]